MAFAVVTVASGGLPVVETAFGLPVSEAVNLRGVPVTKVIGKPGLPVTFTTVGVGPGPTTPIALDPATVASTTLSGGNLVATSAGTTQVDQGAKAPVSAGKSAGKWYFEVTLTNWGAGNNKNIGIGTTASTYTSMSGISSAVGCVVTGGGGVYVNGALTVNITALATAQVVRVAVDLDNRTIWFRRTGGNWNGNVANDPATNTGGVAIPAGTFIPFCCFGGTGGVAGNALTFNFGNSAFTGGGAPAGFAAGWLV